MTMDNPYGGAFKTLQKVIDAELLLIEAIYNFDYGDEFEIAICNVLRKFLPEKYGICRGAAVNKVGTKKGDDIIIYDRNSFPTFFMRNNDFGRKELIPIEAVYAYIECKHNLILDAPIDENSSLAKASKQVEEFKELCNQRPKVLIGQSDPYITFTSTLKLQGEIPPTFHLPKYRNPVFGAVFSRKVSVWKMGEKTDPDEIHGFLLQGKDVRDNLNMLDLVIAGKHNTMSPAYKDDSSEVSQKNSLFMLPDKAKTGGQSILSCFKIPDDSLSYGILHLIGALDWIKLGRIDWEAIINYYQTKRSIAESLPS